MKTDLSRQLETIIRQIARSEIDIRRNKNHRHFPGNREKCISPITPVQNITENIGWLRSDEVFCKLYNLLLSYAFLACSFENFKNHFLGTGTLTEKLTWQTETKLLIYLFDQLAVRSFIPIHKNFHILLTKHFMDIRNKPLKNGTLRSSLNQIRNNKRIQVIENIIDELDRIGN